MSKVLRKIVPVLLAAILTASCTPRTPEQIPAHRVTIMYAAAFSNLCANIGEDVQEMCEGILPTLMSGDVFLVYSHFPITRGNYVIQTEPVLYRAWRDADGTPRADTLIIYPKTDLSSSPEVMRKVLNDVLDYYPAPHYGLIVSSHGKGWIPKGYQEAAQSVWSFPSTRELCIEVPEGSGIDIDVLPDALPMKFDYILMDSCLMGCVEVAYEIREKCDYLLFSPTEILVDGFMYKTMGPLITNVAEPALKTVAQEYIDHYNAQTGDYRSATVTLVDCSKLDALAAVCNRLTEAHRGQIATTSRNLIQPYFYNSFHWFYDLRDIYVQCGATVEEIAELDAALAETVLYFASTPTFFKVPMERVCGLSMYFPYPDLDELNDYYKTLSWNKAIGLIR